MKALIVHHFGKKAEMLRRSFRYENVFCELLRFEDVRGQGLLENIFSRLIDANALIFYISSPDYTDALRLLSVIAKKTKIPIFVLDECEDKRTKASVEKNGSSFYFSKPFSMPQIATEMKFLTYRKNGNGNGNSRERSIDWRGVQFDFFNRSVQKNGAPVVLRNKEFALLEFFFLNRGKILSRNTILEHVWDRNTSLLSNTVDVHVARLRNKIGGEGNGVRKPLIQTIPCTGYRLNLPEERVSATSRKN